MKQPSLHPIGLVRWGHTQNPHAEKNLQSFLELTDSKNFVNQATPRFELGIKDLQSPALPLGHVAKSDPKLGIKILSILHYSSTKFSNFIFERKKGGFQS